MLLLFRKARTTNRVRMMIEMMRAGLATRRAMAGHFSATNMLVTKGNSKTRIIFVVSDQKSTWSDLTSECREGTSEDQKKKFTGVMKKANIDENPVRATASATFPRAWSEK